MIWLAQDCGLSVRGILDDADDKQGTTISGVPVLGKIDNSPIHSDAAFVVAIGTPRVRKAVVDRLLRVEPAKFATLIHPDVKRSSCVEIGEGSIIAAGCILTTHIRVGKHNIINLNCTVGHDCIFDDYCTIAPIVAVSGNVQLEQGVEVGTSACIRQGVRMREGSLLGMGGVLTKDVEPNVVMVGNPARPLKVLPAWE